MNDTPPTHILAQFRIQSETMSIEELAETIGLPPNCRRRHKHADREWTLGTDKVAETCDYHLEHCMHAILDAMQGLESTVTQLVRERGCRVIVSGTAYCPGGRTPVAVFHLPLFERLLQFQAEMELDIYNLP